MANKLNTNIDIGTQLKEEWLRKQAFGGSGASVGTADTHKIIKTKKRESNWRYYAGQFGKVIVVLVLLFLSGLLFPNWADIFMSVAGIVVLISPILIFARRMPPEEEREYFSKNEDSLFEDHSVNINGSPMNGSVDMDGNPFGFTDD